MARRQNRTRIDVTLDALSADKLRFMAEQCATSEAALAGALLARAIDEADDDGGGMLELLNGIPGALERAELGREHVRQGRTIPLDRL